MSTHNQPKDILITEETRPSSRNSRANRVIDSLTGRPVILPYREPLLPDHYVIICNGRVQGVVSPSMFHSVRAIANAEVIL